MLATRGKWTLRNPRASGPEARKLHRLTGSFFIEPDDSFNLKAGCARAKPGPGKPGCRRFAGKPCYLEGLCVARLERDRFAFEFNLPEACLRARRLQQVMMGGAVNEFDERSAVRIDAEQEF